MPSTPALTQEAKSAPARLLSLDVFRGATIASMILVNDPGSWSDIYPPLEHATWNGCTFTDLVFPFFIWISGVAITLSFARRKESGENPHMLLVHTARRAATIFLIGLFLNGFPYFHLDRIRIPGVLQRIAVCYLIASAIYLYAGVRGRIIWIVGLLAAYWMAMTLIPVPGYGPGSLQPVGNLAQWIDSHVLTGHMWSHTKIWDPEGLFSTIPAIATSLFGTLTGTLLRSRLSPSEKTAWLLTAGNALLLLGIMSDPFLPINKSLWTSSYAMFTAGMASVVFGICYWLVDVQGWRRFTTPFIVFGMNAIAMFILSGMLARLLGLFHWQAPIYRNVFAPLAAPRNASLLYAVVFVLVCYLVALLMYRRRWFLKI